jgi:hypothetical membrane protein
MILSRIKTFVLRPITARKFPIIERQTQDRSCEIQFIKGTIMVETYERSDMKNIVLLGMVIIAFFLFLVGIFIPGTENPWHIILVVAGVLTGFTFYLLSFRKMLKDTTLTKGRRMLWTISIVCLPMIGNTFYVIVDMMSAVPQTVKRQS